MIPHFTVARDPRWYLAWPDVTLCRSGRLVCIYSECTHHGDRSYTRIMLTDSTDRGRGWSAPRPLTAALDHEPDGWFWNCPRVSTLADGRLVALVDRIGKAREGAGDHSDHRRQENWIWISNDDGQTWSAPQKTPAFGIVPDQLVELRRGQHKGRWLLSAHTKSGLAPGIIAAQRVWWSDDQGATWQGPSTIAESSQYFFCEGSLLELPGGELVCFLRENSFQGYDAFKSISRDGGRTWSEAVMFPLPACHRLVAGMLNSGEVLITHRFMQGGNGWVGWWTQNFFAALTDVESCLAAERAKAHTRILPIDFDRSPKSDTGYSGWVQFDDGEIYIVNYIVDDHHPRAQIRGYSLRIEDFRLTEK